ncbi:hypothetical protein [Terrabacter sp. NPDC080008]|uniref:hypothetical protein n=1 Tax=Terrabacter sp. NPDC080008 TaxID=3155176 RepID=UPI003450AE39
MSTAAVPPHPRVPIWLRPLTRRRGEVQFGVLPGGPVVTGITPTEAGLLARLDGALPLVATDRMAAEAGIAPARWRALLEMVTQLGVLADRDTGACGVGRSGPGRVVVDGCGDVSARIADALTHAGLTVAHGRAAVDRAVAAPCNPRPDLVVLLGSPVVDPRRGDLWLRHGVPHLPVTPAAPRTTVGPLVDGSAVGPCLWCLERHRADRDDAWPVVMSQAAPEPALALPLPPDGIHDALPPGLAHIVVGSVALFVTGVLEGHSPPAGVSVEVTLPWPRMDHRRWPIHPLCPAHPAGGPSAGSPSLGAAPEEHLGQLEVGEEALPRGA